MRMLRRVRGAESLTGLSERSAAKRTRWRWPSTVSRSADRVALYGAELLPRRQVEGWLLVRGSKGLFLQIVDDTERIA